eukprot:scaffold34335_cov18-Tisochrysis_lutea.AAC.4
MFDPEALPALLQSSIDSGPYAILFNFIQSLKPPGCLDVLATFSGLVVGLYEKGLPFSRAAQVKFSDLVMGLYEGPAMRLGRALDVPHHMAQCNRAKLNMFMGCSTYGSRSRQDVPHSMHHSVSHWDQHASLGLALKSACIKQSRSETR